MSSRQGGLPATQSAATPAPSSPTSRRSLLAAIAGATAGLLASAVPRGARVQAANGDAVLVGGTHTGTTVTSIENTSAGPSPSSVAIRGISDSSVGVLGLSDTHIGVEGFSTSSAGVAGHSETDAGVTGFGVLGVWATGERYGVQGGSDNAGIFGHGHGDPSGTGVLGYSSPDLDPGQHPVPKPKTGVFGYSAQDAGSTGVLGKSPAGHGIHGESATGWAGFFDGRVLVKRYQEFAVISTPGAPPNNHARLFIRNNASGKTQLCVRFNTGGVRVVATEP